MGLDGGNRFLSRHMQSGEAVCFWTWTLPGIASRVPTDWSWCKRPRNVVGDITAGNMLFGSNCFFFFVLLLLISEQETKTLYFLILFSRKFAGIFFLAAWDAFYWCKLIYSYTQWTGHMGTESPIILFQVSL